MVRDQRAWGHAQAGALRGPLGPSLPSYAGAGRGGAGAVFVTIGRRRRLSGRATCGTGWWWSPARGMQVAGGGTAGTKGVVGEEEGFDEGLVLGASRGGTAAEADGDEEGGGVGPQRLRTPLALARLRPPHTKPPTEVPPVRIRNRNNSPAPPRS